MIPVLAHCLSIVIVSSRGKVLSYLWHCTNLESPGLEILYLPHLVDGFGKYVLIPQGKVFNYHCKDYFCVSEAVYCKGCAELELFMFSTV